MEELETFGEEARLEYEHVELEAMRKRHFCGFRGGFTKRRLRFGLLDDLDISIRYVLCMISILAMILYIPEETLEEHFPASFLIGVTASLIFVNPHFGSALSNCISWTLGSYMGFFLAWISILILGTSTHETQEQVIINYCTEETQSVGGYVGNPSPIGLGFLIFFCNFALNYFAVASVWAKGGVICYNVFTLLWFVRMVDPLVDKFDVEDFYLIARSSVLGVLLGLVFVTIPMPHWNGPPRGWPLPRLALPCAREKLHTAAGELSGIFGAFINEYQDDNSQRLQEESLSQYLVIIRKAEADIDAARGLLTSSGHWEPFLKCSPVTYEMLFKYADNLQILAIQLTTLLWVFQDRAKKNVPEQIERIKWEEIEDEEFFSILHQLQSTVHEALDRIQNTETTVESYIHKLEVQMELLRFKLCDLYKNVETEGKLTLQSREHSYHCNCIWKFHNICKTVITINQLFLYPQGAHYPRRLLDWVIEFYDAWKKSFHETFVQLLWRREISLRTWLFHRHRSFAGSFQIATAALIGSLFVLIDHLRENIPSGFAIVLVAILIMDRDNPATQFSKAEARLTGTALAVGGAFVITAFWPDGNDLGTLILVSIYAFFARFIQTNPKYYYISFSFMVTLFGILFEKSPTTVYANITSSTNGRATATTLGVVIASLCNVLWPVHSRMLVRQQIAKTLVENYPPLIDRIFDIFQEHSEDELPLVGEKLSKISAKLSAQRVIIQSAANEPTFWRDPFIEKPFQKIVSNEDRLLIQILGSWKMNQTLRKRLSLSSEPDSISLLFSDRVAWDFLRDKMKYRLMQSIIAIESSSYVELTSKPLMECYYEWLLHVKQRLAVGRIPDEAYISLRAIILNYLFVAEAIVRLCNSMDQLQESIRVSRESGIPLGLCPYVVPASRTIV